MTKTTLEDLKKSLQTALRGFDKGVSNVEITEQMADCQEHGAYRQFCKKLKLPTGKIIKTETQCPECLKAQIAELELKQEQEMQAQQQYKIQALKEISGIAKRFEFAGFDNYYETAVNRKAKRLCQLYATKWAERKAIGGGLILCGKPGTGKNHLASSIAHYVIERYQDQVLMTTALRIIRKVKSTWGKEAELTEDQVIDTYTSKDLLIIDEVGVQFGSEAEKIILFEIINERYEQMKPTILISNLSEEELAGYVGERILDRMKEGQGTVVKFDWESYRK